MKMNEIHFKKNNNKVNLDPSIININTTYFGYEWFLIMFSVI